MKHNKHIYTEEKGRRGRKEEDCFDYYIIILSSSCFKMYREDRYYDNRDRGERGGERGGYNNNNNNNRDRRRESEGGGDRGRERGERHDDRKRSRNSYDGYDRRGGGSGGGN